MFKTYRKTATVSAKLFEKGDEDGLVPMSDAAVPQQFKTPPPGENGAMDVPFITTLESQRHFGRFGQYYICKGPEGERWLVERAIFEKTYEEVTTS
jgi:hypothetical protein